jgi:hypothetical protein
MALWGNTDADGSKPKYLSDADKAKCFFVSAEEAAVATNKAKGITGAGWWLINTFVDADGTTRYKSECLVAMTVATATSGDAADDATVSDTAITITVSGQPSNQTAVAGEATFSVTASVNSGSLTYQWQKKESTGTRWTNVSGATSASLALTGLTNAADNGDQYRVVLGSSSGAKKVTSDAATLTVAAE